MRILIVASLTKGYYPPYVIDQVEALRRFDPEMEFDWFGIDRKGISGYLSCLPGFRKKIRDFKPDLIHAHFGFSGLFANMQRSVPVITTYHGTDINEGGYKIFLSRISMALSRFNVFVSESLFLKSSYRKGNYMIQPCGIDLGKFAQMPKADAKARLGWNDEARHILFAGAFNNYKKDYPLAAEAVSLLKECDLVELKGYSREQMCLLMNAADALLITSLKESGPQVAKEAMACGCPIVSVDVGDVRKLTAGISGCYLTSREPGDIADALSKAVSFEGKIEGRQRLLDMALDNLSIAKRIAGIYKSVAR
jgi:teichuronic acid biosynthesis glycosyltransferase TuaC